jgi:3-deoxy-D-manno-octulosonate 8-phosphate phosphatase (KDO 8-P phosphatase)
MRVINRARKIRMVITDVDGTLTDGTLLVLPDGEEVKAYHVRDGMAVLLAQLAEIEVGIITGKISRGLEKRAERLKIKELHQGIIDKKKVLDEIMQRKKLSPDEIAYIGDDLGDLEVLRTVGLAAAVANAHPVVKEHCHYITRLGGGQGAFREFIEFILEAQNKWGVIQTRFKEIFDRRV